MENKLEGLQRDYQKALETADYLYKELERLRMEREEVSDKWKRANADVRTAQDKLLAYFSPRSTT